jgi:type VI secretion system secreted protein Hcp
MAIYVKFGKIEGDVSAEGWEKWIEAGSFQFGAGRGISMSVGSGREREATKPSLSEVTVTKSMDKSSPYLFLEACVGKATDKVVIDFVKTSADKLENYLKYTLYDALVSSYSASSGGEDPSESVSIAYNKFEMKYFPRKKDNTLDSPVPAGYDLEAGKKL